MPPANYKQIDIHRIKPRAPIWSYKVKPDRFPTPPRAVKQIIASPASYEPSDKLTNTQAPRVKFDKAPNETFIVQYAKSRSYMPASSSYDQIRGLKVIT